MKTTKSDRQPTKRAKAAGKLGRKALHCSLATKNTRVDRGNSYGRWVAEMTSREKPVRRG